MAISVETLALAKAYVDENKTTVEWNQTQQNGTKIAEITIDGTTQNIYGPSDGVHIYAMVGAVTEEPSEVINYVISERSE